MDEDKEQRPSCNCKKTTCLKRYCQCFQGHFFCSHACNCKGCWNSEHRRTFVEEHAELRLKTKPGAPQSKDSALTAEQRVHGKGCTCNKSGCKKNYCECFKKQVACTTRCKCQGCENSYGSGGKGLQENSDPGRPSGKPNGEPGGGDGSPGGSGESAVVIDEELLRPTEAGVAENVAAIDDPSDSGPCIHGGIYIYQNSQPQRNQGPVQAILTHEKPTTTRRIPKQVEIDEAAEIQNIGNRYDCTWH